MGMGSLAHSVQLVAAASAAAQLDTRPPGQGCQPVGEGGRRISACSAVANWSTISSEFDIDEGVAFLGGHHHSSCESSLLRVDCHGISQGGE